MVKFMEDGNTTTTSTVTAETFTPILTAITSVVNVDLLVSLVAKVLPFALAFFVFYWGYGFITSKIANGARSGRM